MKAKFTAFAAFILVVLLSTTLVVSAQENSQIIPQNSTIDTEKVVQNGTSDTSDTENSLTCEELEEIFDKKVERYLLAEPTHTYKYQVLWLKTAAITRKAELVGYDVDTLYENLDELDLLIEEFSDNFGVFIKRMTATKKYICSENEVLYANSLKNAKESLGDVRETARDISYFYEEEIRPNIMGLQDEVNENEDVTIAGGNLEDK